MPDGTRQVSCGVAGQCTGSRNPETRQDPQKLGTRDKGQGTRDTEQGSKSRAKGPKNSSRDPTSGQGFTSRNSVVLSEGEPSKQPSTGSVGWLVGTQTALVGLFVGFRAVGAVLLWSIQAPCNSHSIGSAWPLELERHDRPRSTTTRPCLARVIQFEPVHA